jgi:hypothetical protein
MITTDIPNYLRIIGRDHVSEERGVAGETGREGAGRE